MPKVALTTLGCKVNQFETETMEGLFKKSGYEIVPFEEKAEFDELLSTVESWAVDARKALDQHAFAYVLKGEGDDFVISTVERAMKKEAPASASAAQPEKETEWIQALHTYIHAHLNEDLSLNRLAEECHFHPVYLSRVYRENTGMTLSDYINQCRQEQAEQLLRNSRMTVLEISRLMGFATDNYFCRWFRKRTGISPHSFRNGK